MQNIFERVFPFSPEPSFVCSVFLTLLCQASFSMSPSLGSSVGARFCLSSRGCTASRVSACYKGALWRCFALFQ